VGSGRLVKAGNIGTLECQAEIGVWVQAQAVCWGPGISPPEIFFEIVYGISILQFGAFFGLNIVRNAVHNAPPHTLSR